MDYETVLADDGVWKVRDWKKCNVVDLNNRNFVPYENVT